MKGRLLSKPGGDRSKLTPGKSRKVWWGVACVAVSIVPLFLEILYLLLTGQPFAFIISGPSIPAVAVIWCAMTIIGITTLKAYKRGPFRLTVWIFVLAGLAALDIASYAVFLASGIPYLLNLINFVPIAGTVAACFFTQRFAAHLETDAEGENE